MFFNNKKHKVIIKNHNITVEVKSGANLYHVLIENGLNVPTLCKGSGQCGKCRVRIVSADKKPINKPTKKDTIILAPINIDAGFRLACQYEVKSDIIVDVSDFFSNIDKDSNIVAVKKKGAVLAKVEDRIEDSGKKENSVTETVGKQESGDFYKKNDITDDQEEDTILKPQVIKIAPKKRLEEQKNLKEEPEIIVDKKIEETYESVNGAILIQFPNGIKYYIYSPSIDNISSEGFVKTDNRLDKLFIDGGITDFLFNVLKATELERLILIFDENVINGDILINLISYFKAEKDGIIYEVLQPSSHPKNLLSFFRQITNVKENSLTIPLDNLADSYFNNDKILIHLNSKYVVEDIKISEFLNPGKNPIIDVSSDLNEIIVKDNLLPPDSILFTTFLKLVGVLKTIGIVDQHFKLKGRNELMDKIPLELLVKLSFRNEQKLFNIFRNKDVTISISQKELDSISHLRIFIHTLCSFVESNCGRIENLNFHSLNQMETIVNEFVNLNIIPQKYAKKSKSLFGDPAVNCIKFFNYRDIPTFIKKNFGEDFSIYELYKNEDFNNIYKNYEKEFIDL